MSCCFLFYPFKPMESTKSDVPSSVAEYLEKEKLCQEICETITKSVEGPLVQSNCSFPQEASSLLPELNSDEDVEDILQQISDLLGSQLGDSSQCSEIDGADDLSVDEILRKAEQIVRASTPYFDRKTYSNTCTGIETLLKPIRRGVKKLAESSPAAPQNKISSNSNHERESPTIANSVDSSDENDELNSDEDDGEFETPRAQTSPINGSPSLRKSRSDTICYLRLSQPVQKSSSAGRCRVDSGNCESGCQNVASSQNPPNELKECHVGSRDLSLSDLNAPVEDCRPVGRTDVVDHFQTRSANNPEETSEPEESKIEQNSGESPPKPSPSSTCNLTELAGKKPLIEPNRKTDEVVRREHPSKLNGNQKSPVAAKKQNAQPEVGDALETQLGIPAKTSVVESNIIKTSKTQSSKSQPKKTASKTDANEELCSNEEHCSTITTLKTQIKSLSAKISEFEKFELRARKNETLAAAERQRIKVLQEEVRSQEDLILGYQQENQRLSNDIISAKFSGYVKYVNVKKGKELWPEKYLPIQKCYFGAPEAGSRFLDGLNQRLMNAYECRSSLKLISLMSL